MATDLDRELLETVTSKQNKIRIFKRKKTKIFKTLQKIIQKG